MPPALPPMELMPGCPPALALEWWDTSSSSVSIHQHVIHSLKSQSSGNPSVLHCFLASSIVSDSSGYTVSNSDASLNGCGPSSGGRYQALTWTCSYTSQPGSSQDAYWMTYDTQTGAKIITINKAGYYQIQLTAYMTGRDKQHEIRVYKKSSGTCTEVLYLSATEPVSNQFLKYVRPYFQPLFPDNTNQCSERSTNGEVLVSLAAADTLIVIARASGNTGNNDNTGIDGNSEGSETTWTITRVNY